MTKEELLPLCECGCCERVSKFGNRFITGHNRRGKKATAKTLEKMSKWQIGIPKSDNHKMALSNAQRKRYEDPKEHKKISKTLKEYYKNNPDVQKQISERSLREREPVPDGWKFNKNDKIATNKECGVYLGCYIAERVLSKVFKNVKMMPIGNHGYDIICNKDKKIDIKSSATGDKGYWQFGIGKNLIAEYFLCIAFDNRKDLNPIHLWLIPSKDVNNLNIITIYKPNIAKWSKYEQPLDKVIFCCNEMKEE